MIFEQRELAKDIIQKIEPHEYEPHTPEYLLKAILNDLKEKKKESDNMTLRVEYDQKMRVLESEHQDKLAGLKTQMKHVFNLDLQNLKLTYEHQLKQMKTTMKKLEEDNESLKNELVKKESETSLLKEKTRHFENERKMRLEHAEFLCRVLLKPH